MEYPVKKFSNQWLFFHNFPSGYCSYILIIKINYKCYMNEINKTLFY